MSDTNEFLAHYGIKGMRWGVRRPRGSDGKVVRTKSSDHIVSRERKAKRLDELSTSELRQLNERLQLERSNKDLQSRGALQKIKAGTSAVTTVMAIGVTANAVIGFAKSPAGQAIASAVKKGFNS